MKVFRLAALVALLAAPALAQAGLRVTDPYARVIGPSGVVYFRILNEGTAADALVSATSPDAGMVMLMNDHADANGVMKMTDLPDGIAVAGQDQHLLAPGGDHVMLMGLTRPIKDGDTVTLVLTFKAAGMVTLAVPVENKRKDPPGPGPTPRDAASPAKD